ncbi:PaaI family thioesterase [Aquibium sp. LZ166]|uniref:Medium/long-chain acyl-CoA thioesterase YigI n=1 Tax=Aquibium pacificus TaxID=3153579 RepID=A0ABV3SCL6_9HYPH
MAAMLVSDIDFEERVRASFARQKAMATIGAELTQVTPGMVEIEMPFSEELTQQHGFLHAGVISTALDSACGFAAYSLMPADAAVLTIEFKLNLLAPGRGERFLFRGSVTKPGRTIIVADGQAYAFGSNGEAKLVATMTGTMMVVQGREGIEG